MKYEVMTHFDTTARTALVAENLPKLGCVGMYLQNITRGPQQRGVTSVRKPNVDVERNCRQHPEERHAHRVGKRPRKRQGAHVSRKGPTSLPSIQARPPPDNLGAISRLAVHGGGHGNFRDGCDVPALAKNQVSQAFRSRLPLVWT